MSKEKVRLFTDTDLDGVGCNIVLSQFYDVDCTYHAPGTLDNVIADYIASFDLRHPYDVPDILMISDLSVSDSNLASELFEKFGVDFGVRVEILDHHTSALWLNRLGGHVCTELNGRSTCGTELVYEFCKQSDEFSFPAEIQECIERFVEVVRLWDTWDWTLKTTCKDDKYLAEGFDQLSKYLQPNDFMKLMSFNLCAGELLDEKTQQLMNTLLEIKHREIKSKLSVIQDVEFCGYRTGIVFSDKYESDIGNELCKKGYEVGMIIDLYDNTVSLRSIDENVDVSNIAVMYNGGGHAHAAGFPLNYGQGSEGVIDAVVDHLLDMQIE